MGIDSSHNTLFNGIAMMTHEQLEKQGKRDGYIALAIAASFLAFLIWGFIQHIPQN